MFAYVRWINSAFLVILALRMISEWCWHLHGCPQFDRLDSTNDLYTYDVLQSLDSIRLPAPSYQASTQLPGEHPSATPALNYQASTQLQGKLWIYKRFDRGDFTNDFDRFTIWGPCWTAMICSGMCFCILRKPVSSKDPLVTYNRWGRSMEHKYTPHHVNKK